MYTSAWKIRSRNNSLEREWPKWNKERERGGGRRGVLNTHTFLVIYADLLELIWILDKSILRRLKSRIDWNLECGIFEKRDDVTEQNQLENQQIWNTNKPWTRKSWTRKSWTTNVSASFFLITITNHARVCVCEICWDDRINIVYLKLEILVFYSAFLCFYHVFSFGSSCTMSTLYRFHVFYRRIRRGER